MATTQAYPVVRTIEYAPDTIQNGRSPFALAVNHVLAALVQQQAPGEKGQLPLTVYGADELPNGSFHGEDDVPPGTFH